jgi:hypothetical protein
VDTGVTESGWWLRADPVHLRADVNQILLFDARYLEISAAEAASLVTELNQCFGGDGLRFEAPHPERWYLYLEDDPGVRTCPLSEAIGKNIDTLLPQGDGRRRWHALLTEIQLLLYGAGVNVARESRGRSGINSVWFWGGGRLPESVCRVVDSVYADDPLTIGLATAGGMAISSLPDDADAWRHTAGDESDSLVVLESTRFDGADGMPERWAEHVEALERTWFGPCLEMLTRRILDRLTLYPCNGRAYGVSAGDLRRFWRRVRKVSYHL